LAETPATLTDAFCGFPQFHHPNTRIVPRLGYGLFLPNNLQSSRKMRWAGHVTRMRTGFRWENQKERDNYEDLEVAGRIVLKLN
jgi:hypothetical protein